MSGYLQWALWLSGSMVGLIGLVLVYRAMLHDRARGRRRCPRCWYDMSAAPPPGMTCSECGYTAKREAKLFKTRRRWGIAVGGLAVIALAALFIALPAVQRDGWLRILPTTALILLTPELDEHIPEWREALSNRLMMRGAWAWQWRWLISKTDSADFPHLSADVEVRNRWPVDVPLFCRASVSFSKDLSMWTSGSTVRVRLAPRFRGGRASRWS